MNVYFDNAATTPLEPEVFEAMKPYMLDHFGNPSSIHTYGRKTRAAIEIARKKVAELIHATPSEIFFTSGGTEADNMAIWCAVHARDIKHIVSSRIEHPAVLQTLHSLEQRGVKISYVHLDKDGVPDYDHLEQLLKTRPHSLVALMHANNEIGNLCNLEKVGDLCEEYDAILHSDTVQSMAHHAHNMEKLKLDFAIGSAHKFHGPKGVGFLYINHNTKIEPFIYGGGQERNMRGGTENVHGIVGLAKAMEMASSKREIHKEHIKGLKKRMISKLKSSIDNVRFNGLSGDLEKSLYTVLNVSLPPTEDNDMLLFNLDINGIAVSGGSACASGSSIGSHVLAALDHDPARAAIRFSFSRFNTQKEVDYAAEKLAALYETQFA